MSLINRVADCGNKYKIPKRMLDFLLEEARREYNDAVRLSSGKAFDDAAAQAQAIERARVRTNQWQRMQTRDFRKRAAITARAQMFADDPEMLGHYFRRLISLEEGTFVTATARQESIVGAEERYLSVIDRLHPHIRTLQNRESFAKIIRHRFGEIADGELTPAEKAAADDIDAVIEQTRVDTNEAVGVDEFVRFRQGYLPQRLNAEILRRVGEDDFVEQMADLIDDADGYWLRDNAENLREHYKRLAGDDDGKVGDNVFVREFFPRQLEYKNADAWWQAQERFADARDLLGVMTGMVARRAKRNALAKVVGTDLRKFTNEAHAAMSAGRASGAIGDFDLALENVRGDFNILAPVKAGREGARNAIVAANNVTSANNVGALGWAFLTSVQGVWRSAHLTASGQQGFGDFLLSYARLLPAMVKAVPATFWDGEARQWVEAMRIVNNRRLADLYNTARATGEFAESSHSTGSKAEEMTAAFKRLSNWGVLKMSGFNRVNEYVRNVGLMHDSMALAAVLKRGDSWADLGAQTQDYLRSGGIDELDWAVTVKGAHEGGAFVEDILGARVDFSRLPSVRVAHKWMDRANNRANKISGVVSKSTDAKFKGGAQVGTGKRLLADNIFGLMRDPSSGIGSLIESVARPMRTRGIYGAGQSGVILGMYMIPTAMTYYAITQIRHIATTGEPHDWYERDPRGFINRTVAIASLELLGPVVAQELHFVDNQSAPVGGGPSWDKGVAIIRESAALLAADEDRSWVMRFMSGNDRDRERELARAFKELFPGPGFVEDNVRNFYDEGRDHWSRR